MSKKNLVNYSMRKVGRGRHTLFHIDQEKERWGPFYFTELRVGAHGGLLYGVSSPLSM